MEKFLARHADDIRGDVLEIQDRMYTTKFGGDRVTKSDILHVDASNPLATIVADLTAADHVPTDSFDCIICVQTIQMIFDIPAALRHLHRLLKPGGTLLLTTHGISQLDASAIDRWGEYWRLTSRSTRTLLEAEFDEGRVEVEAHGNVLSAIALLHGITVAELRTRELDHHDPVYELIVDRPGGEAPGRAVTRHPTTWAEPFASRPAAEDVAGLVSVVVPIYNGGALLAARSSRCRTQTYERFELILVDDGSTDDSLATARCFAALDDRIRVLAIPNSGAPARPRNHAIEHSTGEFVAFLDQDDWWFPDKLDKQLARFREGDFGAVYADAVYLDDASEENGLLISELGFYRRRTGPMPHGMVVRDIIRSNFVTQCTLVVRTEWIRRVGPMNESAPGVDCYDHLLRVGPRGRTLRRGARGPRGPPSPAREPQPGPGRGVGALAALLPRARSGTSRVVRRVDAPRPGVRARPPERVPARGTRLRREHRRRACAPRPDCWACTRAGTTSSAWPSRSSPARDTRRERPTPREDPLPVARDRVLLRRVPGGDLACAGRARPRGAHPQLLTVQPESAQRCL